MSVPSHCALLDEPAARLAEAFAGIRLHRPRVPYLSSSRARLVAEPAALADDLAGNMARRVEWLATLRSAYERGARLHLELPPGRVLSGLARLCSAAPRRPSKAPGRIPWTRCCARRKREPDKRSFEA